MMHAHPTTPFGRRSLSLAMVASQVVANACPADTVTHKWRLFRALTEAKTYLGSNGPLPDRALAVLHALLSFHQETTMTPGANLVVFPSNRELSIRANGMAPATLRRHLAALVDAGLIIRRDSPNGKRYARKGQGGEIENAFGFDLTPLVARAAEIENLAEEVRAENRAMAMLRERITLHRRDVVKMIGTGLEEAVPGAWADYHLSYIAFSARQSRTATRAELEALVHDLAVLASEISNLLEQHILRQNMSAKESHSERHIQIQITDSLELDPSLQKGGGEIQPLSENTVKSDPETPRSKGYPLGMILDACPDIMDYARGGIHSWRDLLTTAELVRSMLGISPDAWSQARETMGEADAAVVIAAILQKSDQIKSAGGYLRSLTEKARIGAFSVGPVLMALLRAKVGKSEPVRKRAG